MRTPRPHANATPEPRPESSLPGVAYSEDGPEFVTRRLYLKFAAFPSEQIRRIVLRQGFKWSPARKAWYRPLTHSGRRAARAAIEQIANQKEEQTPR